MPLHPQASIWLHPDARRKLADGDQGVISAVARPVTARRHRLGERP
jgi:hypothetical protein